MEADADRANASFMGRAINMRDILFFHFQKRGFNATTSCTQSAIICVAIYGLINVNRQVIKEQKEKERTQNAPL